MTSVPAVSSRRRVAWAVVAVLAAAGVVAALTASWGKRSARYGDMPLAPTPTETGQSARLTEDQLRKAALTAADLTSSRNGVVGPWSSAAAAPPSTSAPGCDALLDLIESAAPATATLDAPYQSVADDGGPVSGRLEVSAYAPDQARDFFAKVKAEVATCPRLLTPDSVSFTVRQVPATTDSGDDLVAFDLVGKGPKGPVEYRYDYARAGAATVLLVENGRLDLEPMPRTLLWFQASKLHYAQSA